MRVCPGVHPYTNGFHDAANAGIKRYRGSARGSWTSRRQAVTLGAITNFIGALCGVAVAKTIGTDLVDSQLITTGTIFAAMIAGIVWNVITWYYGLPSSSSHALFGGLIGAALASARNNWNVVKWPGFIHKIIVPMLASPVIGFVGGMLVMTLLFVIIRPMRPRMVDKVFGRLQLLSASYMGWAHGFADGQKTMGIIALACWVATKHGDLQHLPGWLGFLYCPAFEIKTWIKWSCGLSMAMGTYIGGWRIIQTLGRKMVRLRPVHGFAAETTAATLLLVTGRFGLPISTTHTITTSIMGVGCARRFSALNWELVERILWAWVMTIPASALLAYSLIRIGQALGL